MGTITSLYSKEINNRSDEYYLESAVLFLDGGHRIFNYSHLDWIYVCQTGLNCFAWPFILVSLAFLFQTLFPLCRGYSSYLFCDHKRILYLHQFARTANI